jgi:N-acetyl sugar amidotransferase
MRYCKKCLFPDTKPDIFFDKDGICDACRSAEKKHGVINSIDWDERAKRFKEITDKYRSKDGSNYDCIVPVSGGKDSLYQAYSMKVTHKMNPLAVTFDQFDKTATSEHNLEVLRNLGIDHLHITLNPNVLKKIIKKSFRVVGDIYWVNHVGIFTVPARISVAFNVPLVIWGENSEFEYGGPEEQRGIKVFDRRYRQEFGGMRGLREEDLVDDEISMSDLKMLIYPSDEDTKKVGSLGLFYGDFFKWQPIEQLELVKKLGWKELPRPWAGSWLAWENCDMKFEDIQEHLKWVKYGYGRTTDQVNIFIRAGKLSRDEGIKIVKKNDGKIEHKKVFCDFIGISEDEFDRVRDSYVNTDIFKRDKNNEWVLKNPFK